MEDASLEEGSQEDSSLGIGLRALLHITREAVETNGPENQNFRAR